MSYTVFARKYRPQTFSDLVGQEHVTRTLGNAIRAERVAHAFLFTGVRGVGKTSAARILAKALNCVREPGPTSEPCNVCDQCMEITQGRDLDVLEIDGASNNSVDDVRRLQESLPYRPTRDRYKVVIVDEVHMLSTGAFNAFLKTLEEPPAHVKFIFATTESHKVPVTIRSRCQRYDFRLIPRQVIAQRVREILEQEGMAADDAAVALVAREAAGSMRDALTLLDQVVAFGGSALKGEEVAEHLGIADRALVLDTARGLLAGDARACLAAVERLSQQGIDLLHFARRLLELMRDLVVLRVVGDDQELVDLVDEERTAALALVQAHAAHELERVFGGLSRVVDEVGHAGMPKLVLEMGLVRLAERPALAPISELVAKLEQLEARLGSGQPPPSRGGGGPGGSRPRPTGTGGFTPPPVRSAPRMSGPTQATAPDSAPSGVASPRSAAATHAVTAAASLAQTSQAIARLSAVQASAAQASSPVHAVHVPPLQAAPAATAAAAPALAEARAVAEVPTLTEVPAVAEISAVTEAPAMAQPAKMAKASAGSLPPQWQAIVNEVQERSAILGAMLEHAVPVTVGARLELAFAKSRLVVGKQVTTPEAQATLVEVATRILGAAPVIDIQFVDNPEKLGSNLAQLNQALREEAHEDRERGARNHPILRDLLEVFPECRKVHVHID